MPLGSLSLGIEALRAAQGALSVVGHNISNINTEGYTRQRAILQTNVPQDQFPGQRGTGVNFARIQRLNDAFTKLQINTEIGKLGEFEMGANILSQVEQVLNEPTAVGLQSFLSDFFNSWHTLANAPEDFGSRNQVLQQGLALANKFNTLGTQLDSVRTQLDFLVREKVGEINSITERIAVLNKSISSAEAGGIQDANDLRDERDLLVRRLNKIIDVTTVEDANKNVLVESQGAVLVVTDRSLPLGVTADVNGLLVPANSVTGEPVTIRSGELRGLLDARDTVINGAKTDLDALAAGLAEHVNRIHSRGATLNGFQFVAGNTVVQNPGEVMSNFSRRGIDFTPVSGSFFLTAFNATTGEVLEEHEITVNPNLQSVNDVMGAVNTAFASDRVTASLNAGGQLTFSAASGVRFDFVENSTGNGDNSDFLLAMGINTFFTGNSALTLEVGDIVTANSGLLAAGHTLSPGDNTNALLLAELRGQSVMQQGTATFDQFYSSLVSRVGTETLAARRGEDTQDSLMRLLDQRLASTTGVSLDEEAANLLIYQRMFQGAAKYVQVMDGILETLIFGI